MNNNIERLGISASTFKGTLYINIIDKLNINIDRQPINQSLSVPPPPGCEESHVVQRSIGWFVGGWLLEASARLSEAAVWPMGDWPAWHGSSERAGCCTGK